MKRQLICVVRLAALLACGSLAVGCGGSSSSSPTAPSAPAITNTSWAPGVNIGPVFLGATFSAVQAELGAPDSTSYTAGDGTSPSATQARYNAPGIAVFFADSDNDQQLDEGETVHSIVLIDLLSTLSISHAFRYLGLGLGSTHAEVLGAMGSPRFDSASSSFYLSGVMFSYDAQGVVTAIVIM